MIDTRTLPDRYDVPTPATERRARACCFTLEFRLFGYRFTVVREKRRETRMETRAAQN